MPMASKLTLLQKYFPQKDFTFNQRDVACFLRGEKTEKEEKRANQFIISHILTHYHELLNLFIFNYLFQSLDLANL
jgi:hypothetical protein